jgi:aspartate/methionine/tyrosine aminotransferase
MTAKRLENIKEYYFSKKLREVDELNKQGKDIINLGVGSPDMPPHPDVIKVLQEESAKPNVHGYQSYKGAPAFRNAIADWYKKWYHVALNPDKEILPLMGSKEGNMHICMTYLQEGDSALVPNPGYPTYSSNITLTGATLLPYSLKEENNLYPDFDEIEKMDLSHVKLMYVNYPQMPTGQAASTEVFEKIIAFGRKHHILIVHDNPYSFILNEHPQSILSIDGAMDVAIELNSLSKSHNMPGWRLGMLLASEQRINEILRFKSNMDSGMFLPLQLAAAKALTLGKDWYDGFNKVYAERRNKVYELLDLLKCTYSRQQTGLFMWAASPIPSEGGVSETHPLGRGGWLSDEVLYKANVFITPGGIFGSEGNNYLRISLCATENTLQESIDRIKASLNL